MIEILMKLAQLAGKYPDFRFMQLIENVLEHNHECHYYTHDSDFLKKLKAFEEGIEAGKKATRCVYVCYFCRKEQNTVKKIIAGLKVNICNECVDLCVEILTEECPKEENPAND